MIYVDLSKDHRIRLCRKPSKNACVLAHRPVAAGMQAIDRAGRPISVEIDVSPGDVACATGAVAAEGQAVPIPDLMQQAAAPFVEFIHLTTVVCQEKGKETRRNRFARTSMFSKSTFSVGRCTCRPSQSAPDLMQSASAHEFPNTTIFRFPFQFLLSLSWQNSGVFHHTNGSNIATW